jgi:hypothetical protein
MKGNSIMTNVAKETTTQGLRIRRRAKRLAPLLALLLLFSIVPGRADDDKEQCRAFYGPFTSPMVPPPECKSPVGLCTHGILTGEFPATYDFTALTEETDSNHPNSVRLTGMSVVTTSKGVIHTDDVSILNLVTG